MFLDKGSLFVLTRLLYTLHSTLIVAFILITLLMLPLLLRNKLL